MKGRVLIVAGSDSGGGAGIQADIKAVTALGGFAATAITALTAQNTEGVHGVLPIPVDFIRQQIEVVLRDIGADALKTGMLHDVPTIEAVCDALAAEAPGVPLVADPVMVAKGGHPLLQPDAVETLKRRLLPLAAIITPNLPEAEVLLGRPIPDAAAMPEAARALLAMGVRAVLLKGGHLEGRACSSTSWRRRRASPASRMRGSRRGTPMAPAAPWPRRSPPAWRRAWRCGDAVARARAYVRAAILAAPGYGRGHGPLDHGVTLDPARLAAL